MQTVFGALLVQLRKKHGITARKFAQEVGLDPSYFGRIERGEVAPPSEDVIARFAMRFNIGVGFTPEWFDLIGAADVARGRIPDKILEQEHVAAMLPAF